MKIYLLRHTAYDNKGVFGYHLPFSLSPEGRAAAKRIGSEFLNRGLFGVQIFSSPIVRAVQTAEIIAPFFTDSPVEIDTRLIETVCDMEGRLVPADNDTYHIEYGPTAHREGNEIVSKRMFDCYQEKAGLGQDCILVSHGDPLTLLYYRILGEELNGPLYDAPGYVQRGEIISFGIEGKKSILLDRWSV